MSCFNQQQPTNRGPAPPGYATASPETHPPITITSNPSPDRRLVTTTVSSPCGNSSATPFVTPATVRLPPLPISVEEL
jgi:hypothetical protein